MLFSCMYTAISVPRLFLTRFILPSLSLSLSLRAVRAVCVGLVGLKIGVGEEACRVVEASPLLRVFHSKLLICTRDRERERTERAEACRVCGWRASTGSPPEKTFSNRQQSSQAFRAFTSIKSSKMFCIGKVSFDSRWRGLKRNYEN